MDDWYQLQARSRNQDVWVGVQAEGKPEISGDPWLMPDGATDVWPFIQDWRVTELPFPVWLAPTNRGKQYGDMLWTGGLSLKIASRRFIDTLGKANVTGYRIFDIDLRDGDGSPVADYFGFSTEPSRDSEIQNVFGQRVQNYVFLATRRVVEALHENGADELDISPYRPE